MNLLAHTDECPIFLVDSFFKEPNCKALTHSKAATGFLVLVLGCGVY